MAALAGQVALITGAGSGMGRATAALFAKEGAKIVVVDIDEAGGEETLAQIQAAGGEALFARADVANAADAEAMIQRAIDTYGRLDILHNNAAALGPARPGRDMDIASMDVDVWDRTMAVNLRGVMLGCKHAIPAMLERGGGSIVNTTSGSAQRGDLSIPAYGVSKGGVDTLTRYVAAQYGKRGIRCNAIAPGLILTHGVENFGGEAYVQMLEEHHLTPRVGRPEDIAHAVLYWPRTRPRS